MTCAMVLLLLSIGMTELSRMAELQAQMEWLVWEERHTVHGRS